MRAKRRMTLALFLALLLLLGCAPAFAEAPEEEELHFENTAKVLFYDERGGLPPRELVVEISGEPAGDAAPSPEDPRVFTGYTACRILQSGDSSAEPAVFTVDFPAEAGLVFGGSYDAVNGRLRVTRVGRVIRGLEELSSLNHERSLASVRLPGIGAGPLHEAAELETLRCDRLETLSTWATWDENDLFVSKVNGAEEVALKNKAAFASDETAAAWLAENPVTISYALEEPREYSVDCAPILSMRGANILWADTGRILRFTGRSPLPLSAEIRPTLRILAFGNSFTYSTLDYLPALLEELLPETEIVMDICYDGGCTLARHAEKCNGGDERQGIPAAYERCSEYRRSVGKWVNLPEPYTPRDALDRYAWDIVILQQSVESLNDFESLCAFAELVTVSLREPALLVYNIAQARSPGDPWLAENVEGETAAERSNRHFELIAEYARRALETPYISAVLPGGTAVQNLRSCSFAAGTGDCGYFAKDAGGHLQQGIAPLAAGYAAACRIAELVRELPKLYGMQFVPTDAWAEETQLPDADASLPCVGIREENVALAKKCAMMALKKPFELTDCSVWERTAPNGG